MKKKRKSPPKEKPGASKPKNVTGKDLSPEARRMTSEALHFLAFGESQQAPRPAETPEAKAARKAKLAKRRQEDRDLEKKLRMHEATLEFPEKLADLKIYRMAIAILLEQVRGFPEIFSRGPPANEPLRKILFPLFEKTFESLHELRNVPKDSPIFRAFDSALGGLLCPATRNWSEFHEHLVRRGYRLGRDSSAFGVLLGGSVDGEPFCFPSNEAELRWIERLIDLAEKRSAAGDSAGKPAGKKRPGRPRVPESEQKKDAHLLKKFEEAKRDGSCTDIPEFCDCSRPRLDVKDTTKRIKRERLRRKRAEETDRHKPRQDR